MKFAQINVKNVTDEIFNVSVFELDSRSRFIEHSFELIELSDDDKFTGFRFINVNGTNVDKCFDKQTILFNEYPVCITEWFCIGQHTVNYVDVKLRILDLIESIEFKLNPKSEIKIQMLYTEKVKSKLKNAKRKQ